MKASELRIGNWAYDNGVTVGINVSSISVIDTHGSEKMLYTPIPLTEEWLEKFGFVKLGELTRIYRIGLNCDFDIVGDDKNGYSWSFAYQDAPPAWKDVTIQYIHQLQNLYHSLTGEELEIKELA